jgi:23S rRNA pseudouridine1911/1915/1917 synthase
MQKHTVKQPSILIDFLSSEYPQTSKTKLKKWIENGRVMVNEHPAGLYAHKLREGDLVQITDGGSTSKSIPFDILYEDQHIIAIDKPAGIATVATDNQPCIFRLMSALIKAEKGANKVFLVHRLDKEASGVLIFAKSRAAMEIIKDNWHKNDKKYLAVVDGNIQPEQGTIRSYLREGALQMVYECKPGEEGKLAVTHFRLQQTVGKYSLVEVSIESGRKHQIRVHLSSIGFPIVGDTKYGKPDGFKRRLRLHAYWLTIEHPFTKETLTIQSKLPKGFIKIEPQNEYYK